MVARAFISGFNTRWLSPSIEVLEGDLWLLCVY